MITDEDILALYAYLQDKELDDTMQALFVKMGHIVAIINAQRALASNTNANANSNN